MRRKHFFSGGKEICHGVPHPHKTVLYIFLWAGPAQLGGGGGTFDQISRVPLVRVGKWACHGLGFTTYTYPGNLLKAKQVSHKEAVGPLMYSRMIVGSPSLKHAVHT